MTRITESQWNDRNSVGTVVRYYPVRGCPHFRETVTRSRAWTVASGHVLVSVAGTAGGVCVEHLKVVGATEDRRGRPLR